MRQIPDKPISIIVAIADNNAIGKDNKLLWDIPADLQRFKKLTLGHNIIMGKNTWYSLPKRPLPGRTSIVITDHPEERIEGATMAYSIEQAVALCDPDSENFIIGGGSIYEQFLPFANKLHITRVHKAFEADTFFPEISADNWYLTSQEHIDDDDEAGLPYTYQVYMRK